MRAKEFLAELFNAASNVAWRHEPKTSSQGSQRGKYRATVVNGNINLEVTFSQYSGEEENGSAQYELSFQRNGSERVTGEGDAQRVFATVLSVIGEFIKQVDPYAIVFYADYETDERDASRDPYARARLYKRMLDRYLDRTKYESFAEDVGGQVKFIVQIPLPLHGSHSGYVRKGHIGPMK
jgi:hypothetical protein